MATLTDVQNTSNGVYWMKDKFFLYAREKSLAAFDKADKRRKVLAKFRTIISFRLMQKL